MLEQAIIDAEQLKETAQRTAEEAVIEKYQSEIKEAVNAILEQEEPMEEETEAAAVIDEDGTKIVEDLPSAQLAEDDDIVEINLDKLEELMAQEIEEGELDEEEMLDRAEVLEDLTGNLDEEIELDEDIDDLLEEDELEEATIEIDESDLADVIAELLAEEEPDKENKKDLGPDLKEEETLEEVEELEEKEEKLAARAEPKDKVTPEDFKGLKKGTKYVQESRLLQKQNKTLLREQKKMNNKVQLLENKVQKYGTVIEQLKQKLDESNLSNAKLLYQNRILNSISLNERQKDKIVEAISNATTVEEAKIIFETLQSAVGLKSKKTRKQESLNEVVTRSSSAFIPRKEVKPKTDAFSDRMKRLAGLK
tara:strand:- start:240 stop:1337 length:1098 start_codon:yes stop_codon:yes gene_type:complete